MAETGIKVEECDDVTVFRISGYFNALTGEKLNTILDEIALKGKTRYVLDFSSCPLINSPGVACLLDLTMKIIEDFRGKLVITGVDQMKLTVMRMVNIVPKYARTTETLADAITLARE